MGRCLAPWTSAPLKSTHNKARPRRTKDRGARERLAKWGPCDLRGPSCRGVPRGRWAAQRLSERPQHVTVNILVGREDAARIDHVVAPVEIGNEAACFAHQRDPRRHVPGRKAALPIGVETAGRNPGAADRGSAEPPQSGDPVLHGVVFATREFYIAPTWMGKRAGDHRVGKTLARRHTQPLVIEESAFAALGGEKLVSDRIVDETGHDRSFAFEPD